MSLLRIATLVLPALASSATAVAQPAPEDASRTEARQLGVAGIDDFGAGKYAEASAKLERAYTLFAAPTLGLWSARARFQLGRWVEAVARYKETVELSAVVGDRATQDEAKRDAREELSKLLERVPTLSIRLEHATASEVSVTFDGAPLSSDVVGKALLANPGKHTIIGTRGTERVESPLELLEGKRRSILLSFAARPLQARVSPNTTARQRSFSSTVSTEPPRRTASVEDKSSLVRPLAITGLAIGGAGVATAVVSALVADSKLDACPVANGVHSCPTQAQLDAYTTAKTVSSVTFWTGLVFAVAGGTALLADFAKHTAPERATSWSIGPGSASFKTTF